MRQTGASNTVTWRTVQKLIKKGLVQPTKKTITPVAGRGKPSTVYKYVGD
jgi:predicted transcriptional regulator